ncbi:hypothetical protein D3C71_1675460 [compost metagenome]
MTLENLLAVVMVKPDMRHHRIGKTKTRMLLMDPTGLRNLEAAIMFGFTVHGSQYPMLGAVGEIVLRQVVAP